MSLLEPLPVQTFSLEQVCREGQQLLLQNKYHAFTKFMLNGVHDGKKQVFIDPIRYPMSMDHVLSARRDYRSIIGICYNVVVQGAVTLFYRSQDACRMDDMHIDVQFEHSPMVEDSIPVDKITRIFLGEWGVNNTLFALITGLDEEVRADAALEANEREVFYRKGFWPAVRDLMGCDADGWSYGRGAVTMAPVDVPQLADTIRRHLCARNVTWWSGIYILHIIDNHAIYDTDFTASHHIDQQSAKAAWDDILLENKLRSTDLYEGHWFVDVGLEISSDIGDCLAWRTDAHVDVIQEILQLPDPLSANFMAKFGSPGYSRDITAHMIELSGFRLVTEGKGPFEACFARIFLTDQSICARSLRVHPNHINGLDFLSGKARMSIKDLYDKYRMASLSDSTRGRIEIRVPVQYATSCLVDLSGDCFRKCLVSFPRDVWWTFHAYRVLSFLFILNDLLVVSPSTVLNEPVMLLVAAAPWFLNSLHSTPDLSSESKDVLCAVLPHVLRVQASLDDLLFPLDIGIIEPDRSTSDRDSNSSGPEGLTDWSITLSDNSNSDVIRPGYPYNKVAPYFRTHPARGGPSVPHCPFGAVFLQRIRNGIKHPAPRLASTRRFIQNRTFLSIFCMPFGEITPQYIAFERQYRGLITASVHNEDAGDASNGQDRDMKKVLNSQSDDSVLDCMELEEAKLSLTDEMTIIWCLFLHDCIATSPKDQSALWGSYCRLNVEERITVNEATYSESDLARVWLEVQWRRVSQQQYDWNFNRLFPAEPSSLSPIFSTGYSTTSYYQRYVQLIKCVGPRTAKVIRIELRKKYNRLFWVPEAQSDTIWCTQHSSLSSRLGSMDKKASAPRILVRSLPKWNGILQDAPKLPTASDVVFGSAF